MALALKRRKEARGENGIHEEEERIEDGGIWI